MYTHQDGHGNIKRAGLGFFCFFLAFYAATYLVLRLYQERTQVLIMRTREDQKRPARRHSRNGPWTREYFFEVLYLYVGSVFRMWNVVLQ